MIYIRNKFRSSRQSRSYLEERHWFSQLEKSMSNLFNLSFLDRPTIFVRSTSCFENLAEIFQALHRKNNTENVRNDCST